MLVIAGCGCMLLPAAQGAVAREAMIQESS